MGGNFVCPLRADLSSNAAPRCPECGGPGEVYLWEVSFTMMSLGFANGSSPKHHFHLHNKIYWTLSPGSVTEPPNIPRRMKDSAPGNMASRSAFVYFGVLFV